MPRAVRFIEARILPRGWRDVAQQIALFLGAFLVYDLVRGLLAPVDSSYKPFGDAMRIIDLERTLHIFVEPAIQAWTLDLHGLMTAADWIYLNGHFVVTLTALVYIYVRRNGSFYFVRNTLLVSMAIALIGYWVYPTAPPRLLPEWGFTDSISQFIVGGTGHIDNGPERAFTNFYAAVPSMHVCFAVIIGWSMFRLSVHRSAKIAWALYPVVVTFVVIATANHYFIDVFLGALTAAVSMTLAKRLLARARPEKWAFGTAAA
jgi:PAP2 superfamily